ncbi:MAG: nitronate monooxygenase [Bacteroidota bacterium]
MPPQDLPKVYHTRITHLLGTRYPIIQAGMVWAAGWRLAVAVSEAGGLGLIGAGSMSQEVLKEHLQKANRATRAPFGINIPLSRGDTPELIHIALDEGVKVFFLSSGHPMLHTDALKKAGCVVVHVIAAVKHARKAFDAGCDAVVAEGFEAGGHNGIDEITTLTLVPQVVDAVPLPVIAAGGIADGRGMAAAFALGAEGVQVGTRFAATEESSAHPEYKGLVVKSGDADTVFTLKKLAPVRMIKTPFAMRALESDRRGATKEEQTALLGSKRERAGIFEGNLEEGEFEAGQSAGLVNEILPAGEVVRRMMAGYITVKSQLP